MRIEIHWQLGFHVSSFIDSETLLGNSMFLLAAFCKVSWTGANSLAHFPDALLLRAFLRSESQWPQTDGPGCRGSTVRSLSQ